MELYFATGNEGKVEDAREILEQPVEQVEVEVVEPCLDSIEEIARAKVEQAVEKSQLHGAHLMADDSGLFVDDLDGFPGRNTSFFDRKVGKEALLDLVEEGADAEFRAAVALRDPETGEVEVFTGKVEGEL
ncbi:MAG: non-canonical purine NTP pyrophosphatase, partial [Candidatus Nanohaloarchaea archaeon]